MRKIAKEDIEMKDRQEALTERMKRFNLPEQIRSGLLYYICFGVLHEGFLIAVLTNNLKDAINNANSINIKLLEEYIRFLYSEAPNDCYGSVEKVNAWIKKGGLSEAC